MPPITNAYQISLIKSRIQFLKGYLPGTAKSIEYLEKLLAGEVEPMPSPAPPAPAPKPPVSKPPTPAPKPPDPKQPEPKPPAPKQPDPKATASKAQPKQPTVSQELIITRTKYPKWWNDEGVAAISLTSPGSQFVVSSRGDFSLYIATIVLTVSGECDIYFWFGTSGNSGLMNFGGPDEPRGMVIAMGNSPAPCGGGSFTITATSDDPVIIGGFVSYYLWKKDQKE